MLVAILIFLTGTVSALGSECPIVRKDLSYKTFVDKVLTLKPGSFESEDAFATLIYINGRDKGLKQLFEKGTPEIKIQVVEAIGTCRLDGYDKLLQEASVSPNTELRSKAAWSYCQFWDGRYADQVERRIQDPDLKIRIDAASCLPYLKRTGADELSVFLKDSHPRVRLRIAKALTENGERCCHQLAIDHLTDPESEARRDALMVLGAYGDRADLPIIADIANSTDTKHKYVRWDAVKASLRIELISSTGDERESLFMSALTSKDDDKCRNLYFEYKRTKRPEELAWLKEGRKKYGEVACKGYMDRLLK